MNTLNYSLTAITAYLGLFAGFILAAIAKEELKQGKRYFIFLQKIILLLVFVFLLAFIKLDYVLLLVILSFSVICLLRRKKGFNEVPYIYIILSVIFYLASKKPGLFVIESSLMFLYGLPTGSLAAKSGGKKERKRAVIDILKNIVFVALAIVLYLIF
ncbi:hypothetical protein KY366_07355 [Candidatus Woesearchaeota archaeon]|nr:hypothetical protein [Candidatus Woesearchaeota archaeon]